MPRLPQLITRLVIALTLSGTLPTWTAIDSRVCAQSPLELSLRHRVETSVDSRRFNAVERRESWQPRKTAVIVCDMWDLHHCYNAVQRENEFAPRLEKLLNHCREQGVTIIHAPSACMDFYKNHPARVRAQESPAAGNLPADIGQWCHKIPEEERGVYPVDQSNGGEDDTPEDHARWAEKLTQMGKDPKAPWSRQIDTISIDEHRDFITDSGQETWNILEAGAIQNVILTGVHTNMCVLGRPFGLRQLAKNGKNVVLIRDLTDTMYSPTAWPHVSHFTGTDLIVKHIEKYVCPTITSDQLIGGEAFVFAGDKRPQIVFLIGEREYKTEVTLPKFIAENLGKSFRTSVVFASDDNPNQFPGMNVVEQADLLFVSVRRRTLPESELQWIRKHVQAGKPVIGIRTANHAFTLRNKEAPKGFVNWTEWDADVFGGSYTNHYGNSLMATIRVDSSHSDHPILSGMKGLPFESGGSLYVVAPLNSHCKPLLTGKVEGESAEPVAWTFEREDGGKSFYTSLGHENDFEQETFVTLLQNAIAWTLR